MQKTVGQLWWEDMKAGVQNKEEWKYTMRAVRFMGVLMGIVVFVLCLIF